MHWKTFSSQRLKPLLLRRNPWIIATLLINIIWAAEKRRPVPEILSAQMILWAAIHRPQFQKLTLIQHRQLKRKMWLSHFLTLKMDLYLQILHLLRVIVKRNLRFANHFSLRILLVWSLNRVVLLLRVKNLEIRINGCPESKNKIECMNFLNNWEPEIK